MRLCVFVSVFCTCVKNYKDEETDAERWVMKRIFLATTTEFSILNRAYFSKLIFIFLILFFPHNNEMTFRICVYRLNFQNLE